MGLGGAKQQVPSPWGEKQFKQINMHSPCMVSVMVSWFGPFFCSFSCQHR